MDKINASINRLIETIRSDEVYRRYMVSLEQVHAEEGLLDRINELRKERFHMYQNDSDTDLFEQVDDLFDRFEDVKKNPVANEFFEAETDICRVLQEVHLRLTKEIDLEIPRF